MISFMFISKVQEKNYYYMIVFLSNTKNQAKKNNDNNKSSHACLKLIGHIVAKMYMMGVMKFVVEYDFRKHKYSNNDNNGFYNCGGTSRIFQRYDMKLTLK